MIRLLGLTLAGLLVCSAGGAAREDIGARIDALVAAFMDEEAAAGIAVAVMQGGAITHMKGYGYADLEHRVPVTPDTVFHIASVSKQFTAMAVLILVDRGHVDLDAPVTKYFPEFPATGPVPTVGQLIDHTSGLDFAEAWAAIVPPSTTPVSDMRDLSAPTLTALFEAATFEFPPGERFRYNNNAYEVAGLLVERVSGVSFPEFLQHAIWDPLGMERAYYLDTARVIPNRASGYTLHDGGIINAPHRNLNANAASGALGVSVSDMMTWQRARLSSRLISPALTGRMHTRRSLADGTPVPYGLGLFLLEMDGYRKIEHYGRMTGTRAQLAYYPDADLSVCVLANMNPLRTEVLESRISRMLMEIPEQPVAEIALSPEELRSYAGEYVVTDAPISHRSVVVPIVFEDGALYADRFRLRPIGDHVFVPVGDPYHFYTFTIRDGVPTDLRVVRETRIIADASRRP